MQYKHLPIYIINVDIIMSVSDYHIYPLPF